MERLLLVTITLLLLLLGASRLGKAGDCKKESSVLLKELGKTREPHNTSCNNSGCPVEVKMTFIDFPPYAFRSVPDDGPKGLMQVLTDDIFQSCCFNCTTHKLHKVATGEFNLTDLARKGEGDIFFPVFGMMGNEKVRGINFLPLIPIPNTMLIYLKDESPKALTLKLIASCLEIWPLVVISLLLALFSGVIIWLLDTWFNVEEFPRPFIKGSLEGFWWAFVSMTTVGYGDRAPKSPLARAFAVIWILIGITIISMVTASLTSSITSVLVGGPPSLTGEKIGVLEEKIFERQEVTKQNAVVATFSTMEKAKDALHNGEIEGIMVDNYAGLFFLGTTFHDDSKIKSYSLKTSYSNAAYGMMIPNDKLFEFCKSFVDFNKEIIDLGVTLFFHNRPSKTQPSLSLTSLFSTSSGFFSFSLMVSGILLAILLLMGVGFECMRRAKHRHADGKIRTSDSALREDTITMKPTNIVIREPDPMHASLRDLEVSMQGHVSQLIKRWESLIPRNADTYRQRDGTE